MAKLLVYMRDQFLEQVDKMAELEQRTRSELIREALRFYSRSQEQHSIGLKGLKKEKNE